MRRVEEIKYTQTHTHARYNSRATKMSTIQWFRAKKQKELTRTGMKITNPTAAFVCVCVCVSE